MEKTERAALDEFGKLMIREVRDDCFEFLQRLIAGKMADQRSKEMFRELQTLKVDDIKIVRKLIAQAVDASIVRFLNFLDVHEIEVVFADNKGKKRDVRSLSDGLAGELYSEAGWVTQFSKFDDRI